jgi:hypothetical protein
LGAISDNKAKVGDFAIFGYLAETYEVECVGSLRNSGVIALGKPTNFFTVAFLPEMSIRAFEKGWVLNRAAGVRVYCCKTLVEEFSLLGS